MIFAIIWPPPPAPTKSDPIPLVFVVVLATITYWGMGFYIIRRKIPKGFDVFEEDF
jgi:hypothetical protein